jgi:hypothetical protein
MRKLARKMEAVGNAEFQQIGPFIAQHMIGIPNTPGASTTIQLPDVTNPNRIFTEFVPSTSPNRLKNIRAHGEQLVWNALKKKYWERKGRKGFFDRTGDLRFILTDMLDNAQNTVGDLKITYDPENLNDPQLDLYGRIDKTELLGYFKIRYVKSRLFNLIPALKSGRVTDFDPSFGLEKALFKPLTVSKLGAELPKPRPLVQPVIGWFLLERIPAAMSRAAAEVLR